ncbi:MAG: sugar phosphate nucleotidyltransferase [Dehalococcoidia bacterium]
MKGIILAAGDGGRLWPLTRDYSKVLLRVADRPVIRYPIEALATAGIKEIGIVVGHQAERIVDELPAYLPSDLSIEFITNPHYLWGNAISLAAAREFVGDDRFVLCMGDHIIHRDIVTRLLADGIEGPTLCVDYQPTYASQIDDATRVRTDGSGRVTEIGKDLDEWNAVDIGVFLLDNTVFTVIDRLRFEHGLQVELSQMVRYLVANSPHFKTCDITGLFWTDIDTRDDYFATVGLLERSHGIGV